MTSAQHEQENQLWVLNAFCAFDLEQDKKKKKKGMQGLRLQIKEIFIHRETYIDDELCPSKYDQHSAMESTFLSQQKNEIWIC